MNRWRDYHNQSATPHGGYKKKPGKYLRFYSGLLLIGACLLATLAACSAGHVGGEEIAFLRGGKLWTIAPDGSNLFEVVNLDTPIIGYGFSPNHQIFTYRSMDATFAQTSEGKQVNGDALSGLYGDLPASLNTVGIDGGTSIPILFSSLGTPMSSAWWSADGTRLLYRADLSATQASPAESHWYLSQSDQPAGIARKELVSSYSIPDLRAAVVVGNDAQGLYTTSWTGTNLTMLQTGALNGHPLPATLERLLWQPSHTSPALLYALPTAQDNTYDLVLRATNGTTRTVATCMCRQFAWSPDGNDILYSDPQGYTVLNINTGKNFTFTAESGAIPYWAPDSHAILLDGLHTLDLVTLTNQHVQVLLSDRTTPATTDNSTLPASNALLQPVSNSLWNADSQRFVVMTRGRTAWENKTISAGLYVANTNDLSTPSLVDNGKDTQAGWSYEIEETSFLV